jgi:serine/threonine-protein kinase
LPFSNLSDFGDAIEPAMVREQLKRIVESAIFRKSARLIRFLEIAVSRTMDGQTEDLKEYAIGRDVFDRGADFDPRTDSIVRVEAARLRRKLKAYYENAPGDPIIIGLAPGSYTVKISLTGEANKVRRKHLDPNTIAVLPFANLSTETDEKFLCEGLAEDIINALSGARELKVMARSSTFALAEQAANPRAIGQELGAGTIVEGSVRRAGGIVRVSAKVLDAESGLVKWSNTFDRPMADVFAIMDEIASAVAGTLRAQFTAMPAPKHPPLEAYALYLRGRQAYNRVSREGYLEAVRLFRRAIEQFPDYAPPYSGLADAYSLQIVLGMDYPKNLLPLGRAAAERAVELEPDLVQGVTSLAWYEFSFDWNWEGSLALVRRALELKPSYAAANQILGINHIIHGRINDAVAAFENAVALDPKSPQWIRLLGWGLTLDGRFEQGRKLLADGKAKFPGNSEISYYQALIHLAAGDAKQALRFAKEAQTDPPSPRPRSMLAEALALNGQTGRAREIAAELVEASKARFVDPWLLSRVYRVLGEEEEMLRYFSLALDQRYPFGISAIVEPQFAELREKHPRFRALMARLQLPGWNFSESHGA